jgi:DNA-binding NtrC family response regulator
LSAAKPRASVLVVDDDAGVVEYLAEMLEEAGYAVTGETDPARAATLATSATFDLVLTDVEMPGMRGLELLRRVHEQRPDQLVVLMTAFGSIDLAVEAMRQGAADFVTKPFRIEALCSTLERALRERRFRREIVRLRATREVARPGDLIAESDAMRRVLDVATRASKTDATVLLGGESGSGKGAVARFIHAESRRAKGPFVQVNCAALPLSLVEAELFGVRKGAFTDAREERAGLFVEASGGTLFLDEIGELPLEAQRVDESCRSKRSSAPTSRWCSRRAEATRRRPRASCRPAHALSSASRTSFARATWTTR